MRIFLITVMVLVVSLLGCSGGGNGDIVLPGTATQPQAQLGESHCIWGYWQGVIDPVAKTIDFVQLRTSEFHLNALPFLEPPPLLNLTLESLKFNGDIIEADIGLRHPFLGLSEFTGFDVCGIFISNGSVSGYTDTGLVMPGENNTRLLNPDGFSRWWNPTEFPVNQKTIFSYNDGLLGTPDAIGNYSATLNGYKYFCDDLEPYDGLENVTFERRGLFSAGSKNIRHYTIQLGDDGLVFNYAVDASWQFPDGNKPWAVPDDFAPEANRTEAWNVTVTEIENTLFNDGVENGGDLSLQIDAYDWYNADMNSVRVESPGNFAMVESAAPIAGGDGYSTYQVDITDATPAAGEIELLISVASEGENFEGFVTGVNTTAYFTYTAAVGGESPADFEIVLDEDYIIDGPYNDVAPSIISRQSDDRVFISYVKFTAVSGTTSYYYYSPNSGVDWIDPSHGTYGTGWGSTPQPYQLLTSMAIDSENNAYHLLNFLGNSIYSLLCKFVPQPDSGYNNSGIYVIMDIHGNAVIFTHDGFPICFGDYGGQITYRRSTTPNKAHPTGDWLGWYSLPEYVAVASPATLSRTRNILRDASDNIHLVYSSSLSTDTWIRMASNSEDVIQANWSYMDIYDGAGDGYDQARDPSIKLESDGDWHCAFILYTTDPESFESIAYCRSADGASWSAPVTVYQAPGLNVLNDATIEAVEVEGQEILVITYTEADMVYLTFSYDEGETWQEPVLMSSGSDHRPDTCATSDGYIHTVWEHDKGTDYRLEYLRAHFVTE